METKKSNGYKVRLWSDRILGLIALLLLITASISGYQRTINDTGSVLQGLVEEHQYLRLNSEKIYEVLDTDSSQNKGFIKTGEYMGYGGPLEVAVRVDNHLVIQDLIIISHNETPSYVKKVLHRDFLKQIIGLTYTDEFNLEEDLDGISGATYTSRALAGAAKNAIREIALELADYQVPEDIKPRYSFGLPEILVILLFALSLYGVYQHINWKKRLRWAIMLVSLFTLGFWLSAPLSILKINSFMLGYWPEWQMGLFWYLLIGGTILILLVTNKNIYCSWICPFGAVQDCLGVFGNARYQLKGRTRRILLWAQRALAFSAIAAALYFRNPGKFHFEIFGTFFNLTGTTILFVITGIYVVSSLFISRPYCDTLCPIRPFGEFLLMMKKWMMPKNVKLNNLTYEEKS